MKKGDLISYDRFGGTWEKNSPSNNPEDWGVGIFLYTWWDGRQLAEIIDEHGCVRSISTSYLILCDN
jgi:hypothetical protein